MFMCTMVVPKHYTCDLGPARSGTLEDRDHPFPAETFQDRDLTLYADPYIFTKSRWCTHLGGLGDWVPGVGCSKEQPGKEGQANSGSNSRP